MAVSDDLRTELQPPPAGETAKGSHVDRLLLSGLAMVSTGLLFAVSYHRHWRLQSGSYDLGIFDQAVYLISQGIHPIVTPLGFHVLGDHAAFILYPLALLYAVLPTVKWLFLVQAAALSAAIFPLYAIARDQGLSKGWSFAIVLSYLLYPQVFNANLYDFHPEVVAIPMLFWAVLAARRKQHIQVAVAIALILSCKAVLSLTVAAMGVLFVLEGRRLMGALTVTVGGLWYVVSAYLIIPAFTTRPPAALARYSAFGDSLTDVARNLLMNPGLIMEVFSRNHALNYFYDLLIAVVVALHLNSLLAFLPALPTIFLNILSSNPSQRTLNFQYALPVVPFLMIWLTDSIRHVKAEQARRWMVPIVLVVSAAWSFNSLSLKAYQPSEGFENRPTLLKALGMIDGKGGVLTEAYLAPQVGHRQTIDILRESTGIAGLDLARLDHVLLNTRAPAWGNTLAYSQEVIARLSNDNNFDLALQEEGVYLFIRRARL